MFTIIHHLAGIRLQLMKGVQKLRILRNHPIIGELINRPIVIEKFGVQFWLKVQFEGLAQHYGIATPFLDMTNNKWVAAFLP